MRLSLLWKDLTNDASQPESITLQAEWDRPVYEAKFQSLLNKQVTPVEQARLRAVSSEHAGDWLNCIPMKGTGLKLDNTTLSTCTALRLGTNLNRPHECANCGDFVDKFSRHGLSCPRAKGTFPRHNQCNNVVVRALISAGTLAKDEPTNLCNQDSKRPDGITFTPWHEGKNLAWDFTCKDTLASSYVIKTSKKAGQAANIGEKAKDFKYVELAEDFIFRPIGGDPRIMGRTKFGAPERNWVKYCRENRRQEADKLFIPTNEHCCSTGQRQEHLRHLAKCK